MISTVLVIYGHCNDRKLGISRNYYYRPIIGSPNNVRQFFSIIRQFTGQAFPRFLVAMDRKGERKKRVRCVTRTALCVLDVSSVLRPGRAPTSTSRHRGLDAGA